MIKQKGILVERPLRDARTHQVGVVHLMTGCNGLHGKVISMVKAGSCKNNRPSAPPHITLLLPIRTHRHHVQKSRILLLDKGIVM